jgi:hypothetical protein
LGDVFLAHLAKGNVSFCHHLASVVCLLTFHILIFSSSLPSFVPLAKRFQKRRFLKIGQSETRIAYGGHACKWIGTK